MGSSFLRQGALLSLLIVLLVWFLPQPSHTFRLSDIWTALEEPRQSVQDEFNRLFSSLSYEEETRQVSFGPTMSLGGAVNLSGSHIMDVETDGVRYLRAVALDGYTGSGWVDTSSSVVQIRPSEPDLGTPSHAMRHEVDQTVRVASSRHTVLYAAPQPLRIPARARARVDPLPVTEGATASNDVSLVYPQAPLRPGDQYTAVSSVSHATAGLLRAAGEDYPDWVVPRYLQLPAQLPPEIHALSYQLTSAHENTYDMAVAIQTYLRRYTYNQDINEPPRGEDAVAWFLFESKQGYCDYYASAMVVLSRSAGIPARLARGYALGEYEPSVNAYRVRERDAHSWVEVYFPQYGWIEWEPTASEPLIHRPSEDEANRLDANTGPLVTDREDEDKYGPEPDIPADNLPEDVELGGQSLRQSGGRVALLAALWVLTVAVLVVLWYRWQRYFRNLTVVQRLFDRMSQYLRLVGIRVSPYQTPYEYAASAAELLPQGRKGIAGITSVYVKGTFARDGWGSQDPKHTRRLWRRLRKTILGEALTRALGLRHPSPRTDRGQ